mmetsp:Transcript_9183/g.27344  ORF Transcript_9183/g.27344 Transcript_9183/m.27344 type:complete len:87 (-) Transcript_9183:1271-1531(-)
MRVSRSYPPKGQTINSIECFCFENEGFFSSNRGTPSESSCYKNSIKFATFAIDMRSTSQDALVDLNLFVSPASRRNDGGLISSTRG